MSHSGGLQQRLSCELLALRRWKATELLKARDLEACVKENELLRSNSQELTTSMWLREVLVERSSSFHGFLMGFRCGFEVVRASFRLEDGRFKPSNSLLSSSFGVAPRQHFKQEKEQLKIENRSLVESVALFEADLEKVSDRHAQLIGHVPRLFYSSYSLWKLLSILYCDCFLSFIMIAITINY